MEEHMKKFLLLSGLFLAVMAFCPFTTHMACASDAAPVKFTYSIFKQRF